MKRGVLIFMVCGVYLWHTATWAEEKTMEPLLCVPIEQIECSSAPATGTGCAEQTAESIRIPRFLRVDLAQKQISGIVNGESLSTGIQNVQHIDGKIILQGAERGRGWSIVINDQTQQMTAAVADEQASFSIFGSCLPLSAAVLDVGGKKEEQKKASASK